MGRRWRARSLLVVGAVVAFGAFEVVDSDRHDEVKRIGIAIAFENDRGGRLLDLHLDHGVGGDAKDVAEVIVIEGELERFAVVFHLDFPFVGAVFERLGADANALLVETEDDRMVFALGQDGGPGD